MKITIDGQGSIVLSERDFIAEGGEAQVYAQGDTAFKLYHDPARLIPEGKLRELSVLDHPAIIRPQCWVRDTHGQRIGFTLRRVQHAVPLARLITADFCRRHAITQDHTLRLLNRLSAVIAFVHGSGCLLVDGNEMNYLVSEQDFTEPFCIDVDSWQTPHFPATALLPTLRDWHTPGFAPASDWFAFGVVACQLLLGIHPYKGRHPDFKPQDLAGRMRANVSVFNPQVRLPPAVRPLQSLPPAWRDWFIALFEQGQRPPPPTHTAAAVPLARPAAAATSFQTPDGRQWQAQVQDGRLRVRDPASGLSAMGTFGVAKLLVTATALYALNRDRLTEVRVHVLNGRLLLATGRSWAVLANAVQVLHGLLYQQALGRAYLLLPVTGGGMQTVTVPELAGWRVVEGRLTGTQVRLLAYKNGAYGRFALDFDARLSRYTLQHTPLASAGSAGLSLPDAQ